MDRFVRLQVFDTEGKKVTRTFNLRYVRHIDEDTCRVMLNGAKTPMVVTKESMSALLEAVTTDVAQMASSLAYFRAKAEGNIHPINATLVVSESSERRLSEVLWALCDTIRRPWWKKLFGLW